jgi:CDP-glycerol glycerophosphotransferase (TagB/SpsB family)
MYHGTSDKVPRVPQQVANQFDYYLLSGPKNEAKLSKASGISLDSSRLVRVGNWMFDPVVQQNYDLVAIRARFGIKDTSRPTVLYAPTWGYGGGTLLKYGPHFLRTIPQKYNLIVRPHYGETNYLPELAKMVPHNLRKWVTFVRPAHIFRKSYIDNMLIADLLISETSSMIYEYLITRRPIIIAETETNEVDMDDDGMSVYHIADHYSNGDDILAMIQKNLDDKSIPQDMESLLKKCFYFNDGKSTQRCLDFLRTLA